MKELFILSIFGIFILGCTDDPSKTEDQMSQAPTSIIEQIEVPFREHGYSQYPSKVISSQTQFDKFLIEVSNGNGWNNKTDFLEKVQDERVDFKGYNLLFFRMTEGSGSISLIPMRPTISSSKKEIFVKIDRRVPNVGTADMAYYAILYKVAKGVDNIHFDDGEQEVIVENRESDMVVAKNCLAWFDGCNDCAKRKNSETVCTERACLVYRPEDFRCTKWE